MVKATIPRKGILARATMDKAIPVAIINHAPSMVVTTSRATANRIIKADTVAITRAKTIMAKTIMARATTAKVITGRVTTAAATTGKAITGAAAAMGRARTTGKAVDTAPAPMARATGIRIGIARTMA